MSKTSGIAGNASDDVKAAFRDLSMWFSRDGQPRGFAASIGARISVDEVSILKKAEEPTREEVRLVCSLEVTEGVYKAGIEIYYDSNADMLNGAGSMHGGCSAYLIDLRVFVITCHTSMAYAPY